MSRRAAYLDLGVGERRAVVALDGRPERLWIERDGESSATRLGARHVGRVARIDRGLGQAFVDLGEGAQGVSPIGRLREGELVEAVVSAEPRAEKLAVLQVLGPAEGPARLVAPPPSLAERLRAAVGQERIVEDERARAMADAAEEAALERIHPLPGGGRISIEPTRALVAVDVDLAGRSGGDARRLARQANLAAIAEAARLLRLKSLGGLVVIDLVGKGHDGAAMSAAASAAFAEDGEGVSIGPISRFGLFELAVPHRTRPIAETLLDAGGALSSRTLALRLVRALEREGRAEPGARLTAVCAPDVAEAFASYMPALSERLGARFELCSDVQRKREIFEVFAK